jgi:hypothetical protein
MSKARRHLKSPKSEAVTSVHHVIASPSLPLILSVAERSRRRLRINSAKQSLFGKEIASSLIAPRNDTNFPVVKYLLEKVRRQPQELVR